MKTFNESLPGTVAPVLGADLLGRIYQLNLDYLELLVAERTGLAGFNCLPDRVLDALSKSSAETRRTIAATAFSLYSLGFDNQDFWRTALHFEEERIEGRYGVMGARLVQSTFCELALLHAWHISVTQPMAARVVYGMSTPIIERLSRAHLWQLRRIAVDYPGLMTPRWPTNPCFWIDIIKFAGNGDMRRFNTMQQLGRQLIAIDLQTSGERHSAVRARHSNLLKQRLSRSSAAR